MVKSIRGKLLLWNALVLLLAVGGFAAFLLVDARRERFRAVELEMRNALAFLDTSLRVIPPYEGEGFGPPPKKKDSKGPPPFNLDRFLVDLVPPGWDARGGDAEKGFAVVRGSGAVMKNLDYPAPLPTDREFTGEPRWGGGQDVWELYQLGPRSTRLMVRHSMRRVESELARFTWRVCLAAAGAMFLGMAGCAWISGRMIRPIDRIAAAASRISAVNLAERIPTPRLETELQGLAGVLNGTFDRLEKSFGQLTRFTADASHELRTPLAILRSNAEHALSRPRSAEDYKDALEGCQNAATRMTGIVDGLLTLARADAGQSEMQRERVLLDDVAREAIAALRPLSDEKGIPVDFQGEMASVVGDMRLLQRLVGNLVENALRYNKPGGRVDVGVALKDSKVELTVADTGIGVPAADLPHLFERFFRVDKARTRATGGTGLGLAICKTIVDAHGGTIRVESVVGEGTRVTVELPVT